MGGHEICVYVQNRRGAIINISFCATMAFTFTLFAVLISLSLQSVLCASGIENEVTIEMFSRLINRVEHLESQNKLQLDEIKSLNQKITTLESTVRHQEQ